MPYPCGFPETNVSKGENLVAHDKNGILGKNHITGGARGAAWRVQTGTCQALEWNVTSILEALPFRLPGALPQNIWIRPWVLHPVFLSWWWGPGLSQSTSDDREFSTRNILQGTSGYEWKWVPLILNSKYVCVLFVGALPWKDLLELFLIPKLRHSMTTRFLLTVISSFYFDGDKTLDDLHEEIAVDASNLYSVGVDVSCLELIFL